MKKKRIFTLGAVAIAFAISTIGWFVLKPADKQFTSAHISKDTKENTDETLNTSRRSKIAATSLQTPEARAADRTRQMLNTFFQETEQDDNDYVKQLMRAMESPAYEEYMKKQRATPGFSFKLYFDFLESQGVESHRDMYERNFRLYYPTGDLTSYEPMMRKRLAELFLNTLPVDPTDTAAVTRQIGEVMEEFGKVPEQRNWVLAHFMGEGEWDWATDIQKNAVSILDESTQTPDTREPAQFTDLETIDVFLQATQQDKENVNTPSPPDSFGEVLTHEAIEQPPENAEALQAELMKDIFAEIPNLPTEADFQKTLSERFSPGRFNTAMQTLNRYGPEEGLRRLKDSDPQIASHIERLIQPRKETD